MRSFRWSTFVAISALVFISLSPCSVAAKQMACFNIGDTVTIRGSIQPGINGGTYFVPLDEFCVHYPKRTDRFKPLSVTTIGDKLPPSIYVEVLCELQDPWPIWGIGIKVISFKNVNAEVEAALAEWDRRCKQWQDESSAALSERTHGGHMGRITNSGLGSLPGHRCGIAAADTKLPHEVTTIWRPEP